ncbi:hypothetical protein ON010_g6752 [Phytophthora cinnamomi]|nr:hypothetical protein ON010_g6752 [Phytophthora cinnamomi]
MAKAAPSWKKHEEPDKVVLQKHDEDKSNLPPASQLNNPRVEASMSQCPKGIASRECLSTAKLTSASAPGSTDAEADGFGECSNSVGVSQGCAELIRYKTTAGIASTTAAKCTSATNRGRGESSTGQAFHTIVVVVQTTPVPGITDEGLQRPHPTAENTVTSTVFQAITEALAVQQVQASSSYDMGQTQKRSSY